MTLYSVLPLPSISSAICTPKGVHLTGNGSLEAPVVEGNWLGLHGPIQFQLAAGKEEKCSDRGSLILSTLRAMSAKEGGGYSYSIELSTFGIILLKIFT